MNLKARFDENRTSDSYQRVDQSHILDIYIGKNEFNNYTLFLVTETEPKHISSSQLIQIRVGQRHDRKWALSFMLENDNFEELFLRFCDDIIESSRNLSSKKLGAAFVCERYIKWQNMLSKYNNGLLLPFQIKGLIGELYFLRDYLIPMVGSEKAVESWIGPEKADQDFVCDDLWYEVKSTVSGSETVRIASIEQLDTVSEGELVVIYLDKTSYSDERKITLNSIYEEVYNLLPLGPLQAKLTGILLSLGYYKRIEYDEHNFKFSGIKRYKVGSDFPCLRKSELPASIAHAKYDLALTAIRDIIKE